MNNNIQLYLSHRLLSNVKITRDFNRNDPDDLSIILTSKKNIIPLNIFNTLPIKKIQRDTKYISELKTSIGKYSYSTLSSIFNCIIRANCGVLTSVSSKYGKYYGNKGIILDASGNIIMLITVNWDYEKGVIGYNLHIDPKIALVKNAGLRKYIYSKVVPFIANTKISTYKYDLNEELNITNEYINIIFDNEINSFKVVNQPTEATTSKNIINDSIIEDIINSIECL